MRALDTAREPLFYQDERDPDVLVYAMAIKSRYAELVSEGHGAEESARKARIEIVARIIVAGIEFSE